MGPASTIAFIRPVCCCPSQLSPCVSTVQAFHNIKLPVQSQIPKVLQQALEVVLASAGNARWSPSAMQLAMAQHPPQDPFVSSLGCPSGSQTHTSA